MIELIFVHIPRCGGTTFSILLRSLYQDAILGDSDDQPLDPERPFQKNFAAWKKEQDQLPAPPGIRAIHGHFWAGKYDHQAPNATRVTWIRDPIKRLVSHYYFWKSIPEMPHTLHKLMHQRNLSLLEFAQLPQMQNVMRNVFLRDRSLENFAFVGIQEHFADDLAWLERYMKWPKKKMPNYNRATHKDYQQNGLDSEAEKQLRALNQADLELYEAALQLRGRRAPPRLWFWKR